VKVKNITDSVVNKAALKVARQIANCKVQHIILYGIPRGGSEAVIRVHEALRKWSGIQSSITTNVNEANIIIDDIVDTGNTARKYIQRGQHFFALFKADGKSYVKFPWENSTGGIDDNITRVLQYIGEDPLRDGLIDTPKRIIKMYGEIFRGYSEDPAKVLGRTFRMSVDEMIIVRDIQFYSMCEHHMMPFFGKVHIAYIPTGGLVVGLSKLARVVDCFAKRLQIQERMTEQISGSIEKRLKAKGVAVIVEGQHLCMQMRGVQKQGSVMVTSSLKGSMKEERARIELLLLKNGGV